MLPNLLNPTPCKVKLLSTDDTRYSNRSRYSKGKTVYSDPYTLDCQPFIGKVEEAETSSVGINEIADGYILVRIIDMKSELPRELKRSDMLVELGKSPNNREVQYFFLGSKLGAAYSDQGGFTLMRFYFAARIEKQN